jgi:fructan beta-fructosidase
MNKVYLSVLFVYLVLTLSAQTSEPYYNELYRPQYHFTPEKNWIGSPAGLLNYEGEYHLFYQYNPFGIEPGFYHWGHAVSTDLLHWEHLPVAIFPDEGSEDMEFCTVGPGSAVTDHRNDLGLQSGNDKTMVIFYTSRQCGQRIAYSTDRGRSWSKYPGNPVLPYNETDDASGPRVFWYEAGQHWVMALHRIADNDERKRGISFYTSENLVAWEFQSHLPGFRGNPDLIELRVNNRPEELRWVLLEGDGSYVLGSFDGKVFTPESIRMKTDFGRNYYGPQAWSNYAGSDGRIIQIAWIRGGEYPEMSFNGQLTFPSELALRKFNTGTFLIRQPIREIGQLYDKTYKWEKQNLIPGLKGNLIKKVKGDLFHIKGQFDLKTCDSFGLLLRMNKKSTGTELMYNVKRQTLSLMGQTVPLEPVDNKIYLDILIDRASVEIYANNGRAVISAAFVPDKGALEYMLYNTGGELMVDKLEFNGIKPVWGKRK